MIVYLATNRINGKRYIGATKGSLKQRRRGHRWDAFNRSYCRIFHAAIRKYGEAAFDWVEIANCSSEEELIREESRLIFEMRPEYNITPGGRGIVGIRRTTEWLERASRSLKLAAARRTPDHRAATLRALEKAHECRKKPVVCITDGRHFNSSADAIKFYGISSSNIRAVLSGRQRQTKGLSFEFAKPVI